MDERLIWLGPRLVELRAVEANGNAHGPAGTARFHALTLGSFEFSGPGGSVDIGAKKLCGLVAILASAPARPLSRECLMSMLWGSHFETQAQQNLRQALAKLRRVLGAQAIVTAEHQVSLAPGLINCDLPRFEAQVRAGSREGLKAAVQLYRGPFLLDLSIREAAWTEWVQAERSRLEQMALDAFVRLAEAELREGSADTALGYARKAVAIDEFREDAHREVIKCLAACGRRAEALRHYEELVALLKNKLGVEPDQSTRALAKNLRAAEAPPSPAEPSRAVVERHVAPRIDTEVRAIVVAGANPHQLPAHSFERACIEASAVHGGRVVHKTGDEQVLEFPNVRAASSAGFAILGTVAGGSDSALLETAPVRMGIHAAASPDPGQHGISLARELSEVASFGQILISSSALEHITPVLDAEVEDLGERSTRAGNEALRVFRVSAPGRRPSLDLTPDPAIWPTIAVVPFTTVGDASTYEMLGEILAEDIIAALARSHELAVISRLSTTVLRARQFALDQIRSLLNATYVLSGTCRVSGGRFRLTLEFADARSERVVWAETFHASTADIFSSDAVVSEVVARLHATIMTREVARARNFTLGTLENSTLLIGAIMLMHQLSRESVELSRNMLETLVQREPRQAIPHAWLAQLHVLRLSQGWSSAFKADAQLALESAARALDADPDCSMALAVDGHVQTHFLRRFDLAAERFNLAVEANPNDALTRALKSTMHAFKGEGAAAVEAAELALRLSPLDPRRWYYDSLAATAALSAENYVRAIELAKRSLRGNRYHTSTLRALAMAQSLSGAIEEAHITVAELMKLQPELTATLYRERHPSSAFRTGAIWADALRQAGVPD